MTVTKKIVLRHAMFLLPQFLNTFASGCANGWLPQAMYKLKMGQAEMQATDAECAWLASLNFAGQVAAAVPAGFIVNHCGKRCVSIGVSVVFLICWMVQTITTSIWSLLVVRTFYGMAQGAASTICAVFIAELSSPEVRGSASSINGLIASAGQLFEMVLWRFTNSFHLVAAISAIFPAAALLLCRWLAESPNDLISRGRYEDALQTLRWLRDGKTPDEIDAEYINLENYVRSETKNNPSFLESMKDSYNRKCVLKTAIVKSSGVLMGRPAIFAYLAFLIPHSASINIDDFPLAFCMLTVTSSLFTPLIIDKVDRKKFVIYSCILAAIPLTIAGFLYYIEASLDWDLAWLPWALIACILFNSCAFCSGVTPGMSTFRGELLPHSIRAVGAGISVVTSALCSFFVVHWFNIMRAHFGMCYNFWIFSINSLALAFFVHYALPETKGKHLSQIQESAKNKRDAKKCDVVAHL